MTKNKQILLSSLVSILVVSSLLAKSVFAIEYNTVVPNVMQSKETEKQNAKLTLQQKNLELKKVNADKEIDRRISTMTILIDKINDVTRLSDAQRASLVAQVQSEITNLQLLKEKIASDTDLDTLKTDKQKIIQSYRIYALFLPKMTILAHADSILSLIELMKTRTDKAEVLAKLDDAYNKTQNAIKAVIDLTPEGYPANKSKLKEAKDFLQAARLELNSARPLLNKTTK